MPDGLYAGRALEMNDITLKIHELIKDKLGVDESAITNNASFYDDLEVDSLDFCELIVDMRKNLILPYLTISTNV